MFNNNHIVCGRGQRNYNSSGNKRLRRLVAGNLAEYMDDATPRSRKSKLVDKVTEDIIAMGMLFVKPRRDHDSLKYDELSYAEARNKIAHRFRDAARRVASGDDDFPPTNEEGVAECDTDCLSAAETKRTQVAVDNKRGRTKKPLTTVTRKRRIKAANQKKKQPTKHGKRSSHPRKSKWCVSQEKQQATVVLQDQQKRPDLPVASGDFDTECVTSKTEDGRPIEEPLLPLSKSELKDRPDPPDASGEFDTKCVSKTEDGRPVEEPLLPFSKSELKDLEDLDAFLSNASKHSNEQEEDMNPQDQLLTSVDFIESPRRTSFSVPKYETTLLEDSKDIHGPQHGVSIATILSNAYPFTSHALDCDGRFENKKDINSISWCGETVSTISYKSELLNLDSIFSPDNGIVECLNEIKDLVASETGFVYKFRAKQLCSIAAPAV